eukprot:TRINITY_DN113508_c0_g1_i1.p1 TRINITY_DN113508_c0_g1~~TRINITY_DN113508_c0_g1_i1.p1  ORF type:complete len:109 (-),score=3.98 TRINITY_DN113508_c0_g1_i1:24-350(-)
MDLPPGGYFDSICSFTHAPAASKADADFLASISILKSLQTSQLTSGEILQVQPGPHSQLVHIHLGLSHAPFPFSLAQAALASIRASGDIMFESILQRRIQGGSNPQHA